MNVEGDFRYVDSGAFDECTDFLEHLEECEYNWEEAFVSWVDVSERWKDERKTSQSYWGPWNLVKVCCILETEPFSFHVWKMLSWLGCLLLNVFGLDLFLCGYQRLTPELPGL